jgi:NADH-quinone oxidoreductase subunit L
MELAWLIPALPFLAFVVIGLYLRRWPEPASLFSIAMVAIACVISLMLFGRIMAGEVYESRIPWLALSLTTALNFGIRVDPLSAVMLVVVTVVSLLVQIYSRGYLWEPAEPEEEHHDDHADTHGHGATAHGAAHHGPAPLVRDPGYGRYFAYISLFTAAMLGLVLADNLLVIYMFWEGVGLGSYLLIGFWFRKPEAAMAAKKAFVTTRFGDFGFLVGILIMWAAAGTLEFSKLADKAEHGQIGAGVLTAACLLIFMGAVGKSAQFPLHVWLPDAMEGPTPVSALIHAATMVAAGVYLVARSLPIFEHSQTAMLTVAFIGGFTAIFAASMGLVAHDIKRVMAFSTVSQLGYMMLGLGAGSLVAGMFHLFTHAFFKALLFLTAGSVIFILHRAGAHDPADKHPDDPPRAQDIRYMGGMWKRTPITAWCMTIASLSLAGIAPLAGFWSKDEVLLVTYEKATHGGGLIFWILLAFALITAFMTAFYMFRVIFLTFAGSYRGPADVGNIREAPASMTFPLLILLVPTIVAGLLNAPFTDHWFGHVLEGKNFHGHPFNLGLAVFASVVALAGIGLAWAMYYKQSISAEAVASMFRPAYTTLFRKYWVDEFYCWFMDKFIIAVSFGLRWFDQNVIDGIVNGTASVTAYFGRGLGHLQTGRIPSYALAVFIGLLCVAVLSFIFGRAGLAVR